MYEALRIGSGSDLLISIMEKLNWIYLSGLITLELLMWKWIALFLRKYHPLRCWGCLFLLHWIVALTLSLLLKLSSRKLEPWFILLKFISSGKRLLCISTNLPYGPIGILSCLAWCRNVGPSLATSLEPLANCWNAASFSIGIT